jgi:hypothetical protein
MKKLYLSLWIVLVVYTIFYLAIFQPSGTLLIDLINQNADPFALNFFNLMGLIPLFFLIDGLTEGKQAWYTYVLFAFGMLGGAYVLLLGYMTLQSNTKKSNVLAVVVLAMAVLAFLLISQALTLGDPSLYFSQFTTDAMVGIMFVDFLFFYSIMILRGTYLNKKWGYILYIPIFGFALTVLEKLRQLPHRQ